jgi:hypothetical protein
VLPVNLEDEHRAAVQALTREDAEELCNTLGISFFLVAIYQLVGIATIRLLKGELWEPDPEGTLAYVTPARVDRPDTVIAREPWETTRCGEIVDLVAWDPRSPERWATRCGHTWLGSVPLNEPFPTLIRRSPLTWLQADCDGVVPLSRDPVEVRYVLGECEHGIQVEDQRHLAELHRLMAQPAVPLKITVRPKPAEPAPGSTRGGGPPPDRGPGSPAFAGAGSHRRRQAEAHWGNHGPDRDRGTGTEGE